MAASAAAGEGEVEKVGAEKAGAEKAEVEKVEAEKAEVEKAEAVWAEVERVMEGSNVTVQNVSKMRWGR